MMRLQQAVERSWRRANWLTVLLWPLSQLYSAVFALRRFLYAVGVFKSYRAAVPVLVVGNLTVGGTGKTPLVINLVEELRQQGFTPGVISRGYGSKAEQYPLLVTRDTPVHESGDEPALIVRRTGVPMVIGADRKVSIERLLSEHAIDIVISDDGLQHMAMQRDLELCLQDYTSESSNDHLLPAGPYRESAQRLQSVDIVIAHGAQQDTSQHFAMSLIASPPKPVGNQIDEADFNGDNEFVAIAGIGNPQRFFDTCRGLGYRFEAHSFPDHHAFAVSDLDYGSKQVLMTEKDAVKCQDFADSRHWYLPVDAKLSDQFRAVLSDKLAAVNKNYES